MLGSTRNQQPNLLDQVRINAVCADKKINVPVVMTRPDDSDTLCHTLGDTLSIPYSGKRPCGCSPWANGEFRSDLFRSGAKESMPHPWSTAACNRRK
jgi:hypothetical protein